MKEPELNIKTVAIDSIEYDPFNVREHDERNVDAIKASIARFGQQKPIVVKKDGTVIAGNGTLGAMRILGYKEVVIAETELDGEEAVAFSIADNRTAELATWDNQALAQALDQLDTELLPASGFTENELAEVMDSLTPYSGDSERAGNLAKKFIVPPYSVLDAKQGYWQDRKREWRALIGDGGESREGVLDLPGGVSLLDPVLSEICTEWFSNQGDTIINCMAGDTVFGFVSTHLGRNFTGVELREEQVAINDSKAIKNARYICDDGQNIGKHVKPKTADMLFCCPPYYDLEVYSDLENDASNQSDYAGFLEILKAAFTNSVECLKDNTFSCIVIGDVRRKDGAYCNMVRDVKNIFEDAGCVLYNELVLLDPLGTAPMRAGKVFNAARKVCKVHQNLLVFYKGDIKAINDKFPALGRAIEAEYE